MKPSQKYQQLMRQSGFETDVAQQQAIGLLDDLFDRVLKVAKPGWWRRIISPGAGSQNTCGLYFWGGVGRGKTLLMDIFYQTISERVACERSHFHSFMNQIHHALKQFKNTENPLQQVARDIADRVSVLCLDEFVIIDIADAMIMSALLESLFERGVVLVTTSNAAPENLYKDGLQRARFLPAIDLITQYCQVENLDGGEDYRLRFLQKTDLYTVPHNALTLANIEQYLAEHVTPTQSRQQNLLINGRELNYQYCAEDTVWFSFSELCETNRSQNDYLELARFFNTLILTDIRQMDSQSDDVARRFVLLIDVLYDHHVKLICSAAAAPGELYLGKRLGFEFERTASRLIEMQSQEYLAGAHTLQ